MTTDQRETLVREVRIDAPPELIFDYFIDPAKMLRWKGITAELDPRPGGVYRVDMNGRNTILGVYLEVDRPHRVVMTFGWDEPGHPMPPGSTRLEIDLIPEAMTTLVRLTHRDLPVEMAEMHGQGWTHYLDRLVIASTGGDAGRDPWIDPPGEVGTTT